MLVPKEAKMEGVAWVTLCEVVLHIAKRVRILACVLWETSQLTLLADQGGRLCDG